MNRDTLLHILDRARWAPSGDNTQPWRFEIVADDCVIVHGHDTRDHVLYDFDGHPSHIAHGALLETLRIAASDFGLTATWTVKADPELRNPRYRVEFVEDPGVGPDPLSPFIEKRTVQRRPMRLQPLTAEQFAALGRAVGDRFSVRFFSDLSDRWAIARLLWANARIRLTCREAFAVHRNIIEWGARYSETKVPDQAVGVDPATARLMRWVMKSWTRVEFFNRYLLGTVPPRIQLDLLPALFCASHLLILPKSVPDSLEDWIDLGGAIQRLWLTATQQGLHLQPQMTPVIFRWYVQSERSFSADPGQFRQAKVLSGSFEQWLGCSGATPFGFFCRVGNSQPPWSRSIRLSLKQLIHQK